MTNSRAKGAAIEREAAKFLREIGFESARRGVQYSGSKDSPDVMCDELAGVHFEVKGDERINLATEALNDAMEQASDDAGIKRPVVLWRRKRTGWRLTFLADAPCVYVTVTGAVDIRHALLYLQVQSERTVAA